MTVAAGQVGWDSSGASTNAFIVPFETEKNIFHQFRARSAFGRLSKPMASMTVGSGPQQREVDVGVSAAIMSKEITSGDEVRFTMEQNMAGVMTFGDNEVRVGDYLAYLHMNVFVNQQDTPAVPLQGEMSALRAVDVISNQASAIRNQITTYMAEQYSYDVMDAFWMGASQNLLVAKSQGGRALDLDLGAGVQVSPENFFVAGSGLVSGTSGTAAYETNVLNAFAGLTDTAGDYITRDFVHNLRAAVSQQKVQGISGDGGGEVWYCPCDPLLLTRLTKPGMPLYEAQLRALERSKGNPVFGQGELMLDNFMFFPEPRLAQYAPDISSGAIVWGSANPDRRETTAPSNVRLMMVLGSGGLLEGHNGGVSFTEDTGFHGKGRTIAAHIKQAHMRARWKSKDGRATAAVIQQGLMACAFYEPGLEF